MCKLCRIQRALINFNNLLILRKGIVPLKIYIKCNHFNKNKLN